MTILPLTISREQKPINNFDIILTQILPRVYILYPLRLFLRLYNMILLLFLLIILLLIITRIFTLFHTTSSSQLIMTNPHPITRNRLLDEITLIDIQFLQLQKVQHLDE